ncbi:MAG: hypothetical protein AAF682_08275 [Planctomycetota bacterium]
MREQLIAALLSLGFLFGVGPNADGAGEWSPAFEQMASGAIQTYAEDMPPRGEFEEELGGYYQGYRDKTVFYNAGPSAPLAQDDDDSKCDIYCTYLCTVPCTVLCTYDCTKLCTAICTLECTVPCTYSCTAPRTY